MRNLRCLHPGVLWPQSAPFQLSPSLTPLRLAETQQNFREVDPLVFPQPPRSVPGRVLTCSPDRGRAHSYVLAQTLKFSPSLSSSLLVLSSSGPSPDRPASAWRFEASRINQLPGPPSARPWPGLLPFCREREQLSPPCTVSPSSEVTPFTLHFEKTILAVTERPRTLSAPLLPQ